MEKEEVPQVITVLAVLGVMIYIATKRKEAIDKAKATAASEPKATSGLGFVSWPWSKHWYTMWDGTAWLPSRYLASSEATDWRLNTMEKNWNRTVYLYKYDNGWKRA